jgi:diguanylate cyclase (GGDEF)-like protein
MFGLQTVAEGGSMPPAFPRPSVTTPGLDMTCNVSGGALRRVYQELSINALRRGEPLSLVLLSFEIAHRLTRRDRTAALDRMMSELGRVLLTTFRETDVVARWGDDQIAVLLPRTDSASAARAAEKALLALSRGGSLRVADGWVEIAAAAGVAAVQPGAPFADTLDEALRYAQLARRKGTGRVQWQGGEVVALGSRIAVLDAGESLSDCAHVFTRLGGELVHLPDAEGCMAVASTGLALIVVMLEPDPSWSFLQIERIRQHRILGDRPILVIGDAPEYLPPAFEIGADDFVVRPVHPAELGARVQRLLGRRRLSPHLQP